MAHQNLMNGQHKWKEFALIVDSILFYAFLGAFGFLAIYLFPRF
jgi:nitrate reductase NapE component